MTIEMDEEWCIHGMYPPEKCTICIHPEKFKFDLKEDDGKVNPVPGDAD